jgi:cellobiose phosphorylase
MTKRRKECPPSWWAFIGEGTRAAPTGEFLAVHAEQVSRLYFPLVNEVGLRSWVTPGLQGAPALSHHEYLGVPLTCEDLPNNLLHRGFWLVDEKGAVASLGRVGAACQRDADDRLGAVVNAGLGWFRVTRRAFGGRAQMSATLWCPADVGAPIEVMLIEVRNRGRETMRLDAYAAMPVFARSADNVRDHRHVTALLNRVRKTRHGVVVCPTMSFDERGHQPNRTWYASLAFGPNGRPPAAIWATQAGFIGEGGSFVQPRAVWMREKQPAETLAAAQGKEALGGFRFDRFVLKPGAVVQFVLIGGITRNAADISKWEKWGRSADGLKQSLNRTANDWLRRVRRIRFETPDQRLNNWLVWVGFQPFLRRLYGNSFLPEFDYGRGGKGWRDLWQDCLALLLAEPDEVRPMLRHNFGGVRMDGSNATIIGSHGEFIADRNNIPRTWMDHGCWPTYTTLLYVDQSGDVEFLLNEREYFRDPQTHRCRHRDDTWSESDGRVLRDRKGRVYRGTLLEHMLVQNLTAFFNVGEHNVCRMEGADWNDGLDMARERGESVAFTAFYAWNLERLADVVEWLAERGHSRFRLAEELQLLLDTAPGGRRVNYASWRARQARLNDYMDAVARRVSGKRLEISAEKLAGDLRAKSRDLAERIRTQEWTRLGGDVGCFNGYYDNQGRRVEGRRGGVVRITLTGQVFPLMAGLASEEQIGAVTRAVERWLKDPVTKGIRLNTDFGEMQPALGRAFAFAYGEKENGAVFNHMAVMYAYALYRLRRSELGRRVWAALYCAVTDTYRAKIFPCLPEYFNAEGRGMYAYLTGSASWLVYLLLTQVYGVRGERGDLVLDPQLLADEFDDGGVARVECVFAGRRWSIEYRNAQRKHPSAYRVRSVGVNGQPLALTARPAGGVVIPRRLLSRFPSGRLHRMRVELG